MCLLKNLAIYKEAISEIELLTKTNDLENLYKLLSNKRYEDFFINNKNITFSIVEKVISYLERISFLNFKRSHYDISVYLDKKHVAKILSFENKYYIIDSNDELEFKEYRLHENFNRRFADLSNDKEKGNKINKNLGVLEENLLVQKEKIKKLRKDAYTIHNELLCLGFNPLFENTKWIRLVSHFDSFKSQSIANKLTSFNPLLNHYKNVVIMESEDMDNIEDYYKYTRLFFTIPPSLFNDNSNIEILDIEYSDIFEKENWEYKNSYNNGLKLPDKLILRAVFKINEYTFYMNDLGFIRSTCDGVSFIKKTLKKNSPF